MVYRLNLEGGNRELLSRITVNPNICHGKPCIRGMRWPVEVLLGLVRSGMSYAEIIEEHPELTETDIEAAIEYDRVMNDRIPLEP